MSDLVPTSMAIVCVDPETAAINLRSALGNAVTPELIGQRLREMLDATKIVSTPDGAETIPDWVAREKAMRFYADYLVGKPKQAVEHRLKSEGGSDESAIRAKLANPAYARAILEETLRHLPEDEARRLLQDLAKG